MQPQCEAREGSFHTWPAGITLWFPPRSGLQPNPCLPAHLQTASLPGAYLVDRLRELHGLQGLRIMRNNAASALANWARHYLEDEARRRERR